MWLGAIQHFERAEASPGTSTGSLLTSLPSHTASLVSMRAHAPSLRPERASLHSASLRFARPGPSSFPQSFSSEYSVCSHPHTSHQLRTPLRLSVELCCYAQLCCYARSPLLLRCAFLVPSLCCCRPPALRRCPSPSPPSLPGDLPSPPRRHVGRARHTRSPHRRQAETHSSSSQQHTYTTTSLSLTPQPHAPPTPHTHIPQVPPPAHAIPSPTRTTQHSDPPTP